VYIAHTDKELTDELARLKAEQKSLITKWTAGDTSVEKQRGKVESQLREIIVEIQQRPALAHLIQRQRDTVAVASFS
jgi:hypothetical protein